MNVEMGGNVARPEGGKSRKVFLRRGSVDHARLQWRSGAAIEIAWGKQVTPYVGGWVCNGDLGGYHHIAVEPATRGGDPPPPAGPPPLLSPGQAPAWWVEVRHAPN